jgi:hypothetical protein
VTGDEWWASVPGGEELAFLLKVEQGSGGSGRWGVIEVPCVEPVLRTGDEWKKSLVDL